jgi:hypothetical protein
MSEIFPIARKKDALQNGQDDIQIRDFRLTTVGRGSRAMTLKCIF